MHEIPLRINLNPPLPIPHPPQHLIRPTLHPHLRPSRQPITTSHNPPHILRTVAAKSNNHHPATSNHFSCHNQQKRPRLQLLLPHHRRRSSSGLPLHPIYRAPQEAESCYLAGDLAAGVGAGCSGVQVAVWEGAVQGGKSWKVGVRVECGCEWGL